jgi:dipeptidyl aminopeptidase/acylaminoacyl peptidase
LKTLEMLKAIVLSTAILLICGCSASPPAGQEEMTGRWEGIAEIPGAKTKAIVDFTGGIGKLNAVISVPDQRLLSKPLTNVRYEAPQVHFELQTSERKIIFNGSRHGEVISGTVVGGQKSGPLFLRYMGTTPTTPYAQEEVSFHNGDVALAGTLLIPPTVGRHPAVVLIHGSSTPSRNDFRFYGDLFVRRGIAVLIYDKRAGADLSGASRVDLRDLAADALAGVALLKARADIDPTQIGLWGHSEGGWVAPIAAALSNDVAFVITFSGPGVTYAEVNKFADANRLRAHGYTEPDIREATEALTRVDDYVRRGGDEQTLQSFLDETWQKPWASQTTLPRRVPNPEETHAWLRWRNLDLDPVSFWQQIKVPALVMFGELDDVVPVQISAERIAAALRLARNRDVTIKIFPNDNHTIEHAPDFLDTMLDWTGRRVRVSN